MVRSVSPTALSMSIPGLWDHVLQRHLDEVERGDARAMFEDDPARRAAMNASPNSTRSVAKRIVAAMMSGRPQEIGIPASRIFSEINEIPWIVDRRVSRIRVWPDDRIEPVRRH